jgi:hypothetical protein
MRGLGKLHDHSEYDIFKIEAFNKTGYSKRILMSKSEMKLAVTIDWCPTEIEDLA